MMTSVIFPLSWLTLALAAEAWLIKTSQVAMIYSAQPKFPTIDLTPSQLHENRIKETESSHCGDLFFEAGLQTHGKMSADAFPVHCVF